MEQKLLMEANQWFIVNYGETAQKKGYFCTKIWYKPIFLGKFPEVVFAPSEVEANAFIRNQKILRRYSEFMLLFMMSIIPLLAAVTYFFGLDGIWKAVYGLAVLLIVSVGLYFYSKSQEKIYKDKLITYMESR